MFWGKRMRGYFGETALSAAKQLKERAACGGYCREQVA
jgi:hypothetical protein